MQVVSLVFWTIASFANLLRQSLPLYENGITWFWNSVQKSPVFSLCWKRILIFFNFILKQDSNFSPPSPLNFKSSISITQFSNPFSVLKTRAVIRSASTLLRWFKWNRCARHNSAIFAYNDHSNCSTIFSQYPPLWLGNYSVWQHL